MGGPRSSSSWSRPRRLCLRGDGGRSRPHYRAPGGAAGGDAAAPRRRLRLGAGPSRPRIPHPRPRRVPPSSPRSRRASAVAPVWWSSGRPALGSAVQALIGSDGRFLVERLAVSYATSLTALREQRGRAANRGDRPRAVAAFGNPQLPARRVRRRDPRRCAGAAAGGRPRGAGPRPSLRRGESGVGGSEATEAAFKREAGVYAIVHVATHGILDDVDPMSSHLLLAPSGRGPRPRTAGCRRASCSVSGSTPSWRCSRAATPRRGGADAARA